VLICFGQSKKFKAYADTVQVEANPYIQNHNWETFFASENIDQELNLLDVDNDLLNATVFFTINKYRKKKRRVPFVADSALFVGANAYGNYYRSSSFRRSEWTSKKANKNSKYTAQKFGFNGEFVKAIISKPALLDKKVFLDFYHDHKADEELADDLGLYYGTKPKPGDSIGELKPIEPYTYRSFAEILAKQWCFGAGKRTIKNKGYSVAACYVLMDEKSLFKSRIPNAKAIFILGGNQMDLLPHEDDPEPEPEVENNEILAEKVSSQK